MSTTYITKQGDMWDSIAANQLGSAAHADKIMNLNSQYIDVYIFQSGIVLTLPDVSTTAPSSVPPWKRVNG